MSRLSAISLFSGAGGLDVGIDKSQQFELLACVELVPAFCETLRHNRDRGLFGSPKTKVIEADLSRVSAREICDAAGIRPGELDLLVGGPPCQSFSTAGRRQSVMDPRGTLLWQYLRLIVELQPRFFLMENVRGVLSAALQHRPIARRPPAGGPPLAAEEMPGSVIQLWVDDLARLADGAYRVDCFEVNAVNYGASQIRERALFVGNREGKLVDFPQPTHGPVDPKTGQVVEELLPFTTLGEALTGLEDRHPQVLDFSPRKKGFLAMVPPGGNWRTLPPEVASESMGRAYHAKGGRSGWWRRLSWDLPCPTIVTMPNHASTSMCHPEEVRALSVAECARVQGFPDGWVFAGSIQEQMTQVGNAVPARLGEVSAHTIAKGLRSGRRVTNAPPHRRVYIKSHVRTRQWFKQGQVFVWDGIGGTAHYDPAGPKRSAA